MDLEERWLQLCAAQGLDGAEELRHMAHLYTYGGRAYHNELHVLDCLQLLDEYRELAEDATAVEFALFYHDLSYNPRSSDNEQRSAELAADFLHPHAPALAQSVAQLILATRHASPPSTTDEALICDIDLSILGSDRQTFDQYRMNIRMEYNWISHEEFGKGRRKVVAGFLARDPLYHTPALRKRFQPSARKNLTRELKLLDKHNGKGYLPWS